MVKKGATPSKRGQAKKAFEVDNDYDSDFDGDSSEEMVVQKTPKNKTPQGRNSQSMSAKKVSFELSGKKTPGKTPQKDNSFIGKKQPTPVAKGMKGNKGVQKKKSEEMDDDDDDDDEDDDDFELDMDEDDSDDDIDDDDDDEEEEQIQKQTKLNSKQTPKGKSSSKENEEMDDDDDDDEDDDDFELDMDEDDSDDDIDDDDNDEEEEPIQKQTKLNSKQTPKGKSSSKDDSDEDEDEDDGDEEEQIQKQKNVKTPTKGADKSKEPQMPKANTPKNKIKENGKSKESVAGLDMNAERRRERDLVTLFAGNLPVDVTPDELRALSSDIVDVFIPLSKKTTSNKYAFLRFTSEEKADANYKALQGTELKGLVLNIDYTGEKSNKLASNPRAVNNKELVISGIPHNGTIADVATRFPKAYVVSLFGTEHNRSAKIGFLKEEDAAEAYNLKEIEIDGYKLAILFAAKPVPRKHNRSKGPNKRNFERQGYNPAKKMRFSK